MKVLTCVTFFLVATIGIFATHGSPVQTPSEEDPVVPGDPSILPVRDYMSNLIWIILKLTVGDFLKNINTMAVNVDQLINDTSIQFTNTYNSATPASLKPEILALKNDFINRSVESMMKVWSPLRVIVPSITSQPEYTFPNDSVSELIRNLLGITLEELLITIYDALRTVHGVLISTSQQMENIASRANSATAFKLEIISRDYIDEINHKIQPIIESLRKVL